MTQPVRIHPNSQTYAPSAPTHQAAVPGGDFARILGQSQDLKFSNHAQKRLQTREITLTDDGLSRLVSAVEKAEKRGGRESLVLMDNLAFIVNVKERTVVTAMDTQRRGEGVFTQIDTVVFADPETTQAR